MTTARHSESGSRQKAVAERVVSAPVVSSAPSRPKAPAVPEERPVSGDPGLLDIQRGAGNRAALRFLAQAKLEVGRADDPYEREADAIAEGVVARLGTGQVTPRPEDEVAPIARHIQRRTTNTAPIGPEGGEIGHSTEQEIESARHGGAALAPEARGSMEQAFGADFSSVRVHEGSSSANLNRQLGAQAFTVGSDIFFRDRVPDTSTHEGRHLLAHELTHTLQQGAAVPRSVQPVEEDETAETEGTEQAGLLDEMELE